jgi:hypothetical protein
MLVPVSVALVWWWLTAPDRTAHRLLTALRAGDLATANKMLDGQGRFVVQANGTVTFTGAGPMSFTSGNDNTGVWAVFTSVEDVDNTCTAATIVRPVFGKILARRRWLDSAVPSNGPERRHGI